MGSLWQTSKFCAAVAGPVVIESALVATLLFVLAAAASVALRRRSAALRHGVWLSVMFWLLAGPILSWALPGWRVLPGWADPDHWLLRRGARDLSGWQPPEPLIAPDMTLNQTSHSAHGSTSAEGSDPWPDPAARENRPTAFSSAEAAVASPTWAGWLGLVWALGAAMCLARLLVAHGSLGRAARRCREIGSDGEAPCFADGDARVLSAYAFARERLGLRRSVVLLLGPAECIPRVWGVWRPRLQLPAELPKWSNDKLQSVLLHELAHVRRRDALAQWVSQLACALYWFHPLVWCAAWRLHIERERACDDQALGAGVKPSAYATHLVEIAAGRVRAEGFASSGILNAGLAMARRGTLETRVAEILAAQSDRRRLSGVAAVLLLLLSTGLAAPLVMLRGADDGEPAAVQPPQDPPENVVERFPPFVPRGEPIDPPGDAPAVALGIGRWKLTDGIIVEVRGELFHATDVSSWGVIRWPEQPDGSQPRHKFHLAADFFANRDPWLLVWERGTHVLWALEGDSQSSQDFHRVQPTARFVRRIDFRDPRAIRETSWSFDPGELPQPVLEQFQAAWHWLKPQPGTPSDARPGEFVSWAEDARPIVDIAVGDWKNADGPVDVKLHMPEDVKQPVSWIIAGERPIDLTRLGPTGRITLEAELERVDEPKENAVRLIYTFVPDIAQGERRVTLGWLRRGIGNRLIFDLWEETQLPEYPRARGVVLTRHDR